MTMDIYITIIIIRVTIKEVKDYSFLKHFSTYFPSENKMTLSSDLSTLKNDSYISSVKIDLSVQSIILIKILLIKIRTDKNEMKFISNNFIITQTTKPIFSCCDRFGVATFLYR